MDSRILFFVLLLCFTTYNDLIMLNDITSTSIQSSTTQSSTSTDMYSCSRNPKDLPKSIWMNFSGRKWSLRARKSQALNPGPNYFDNTTKNVCVDEKGYLHLRITKQQDKWRCSSIYSNQSLGYGTYIWLIDSSFSKIDKNTVVGLFTYYNDTSEIDIQLSKWGNQKKNNTQFAVQPYYLFGNQNRYNTSLINNSDIVHAFKWTPNKIYFKSFYSNSVQDVQNQIDKQWSNNDNIVNQWVYSGSNIPSAGKQKVVMNFWLYKGIAPAGQVQQEIIIKKFKFEPFKPATDQIQTNDEN